MQGLKAKEAAQVECVHPNNITKIRKLGLRVNGNGVGV